MDATNRYHTLVMRTIRMLHSMSRPGKTRTELLEWSASFFTSHAIECGRSSPVKRRMTGQLPQRGRRGNVLDEEAASLAAHTIASPCNVYGGIFLHLLTRGERRQTSRLIAVKCLTVRCLSLEKRCMLTAPPRGDHQRILRLGLKKL